MGAAEKGEGKTSPSLALKFLPPPSRSIVPGVLSALVPMISVAISMFYSYTMRPLHPSNSLILHQEPCKQANLECHALVLVAAKPAHPGSVSSRSILASRSAVSSRVIVCSWHDGGNVDGGDAKSQSLTWVGSALGGYSYARALLYTQA